MNIDVNISDILREIITFLECLRDAQLPLTLEILREKLLMRSKNTLSITTMARSSSPEAYMDMNSGPKSLLLTKNETDLEEYVGKEDSSKKTYQDYYETFTHEDQTITTATIEHPKKGEGQDESEMLIGIYKNLSAVQSKSKCYKCGPLYRKEGKKLFLSENRACWMALLGSHLLIYRSERHNRPYAIYPIRGYMARAAPNLLPRDRQKSESAFEMYCPGSETLQFIARTPKDRDQWIVKVCEIGCGNESVKSTTKIRENRTTTKSSTNSSNDNEKSQRDAKKSLISDKSMTIAGPINDDENEAERKNIAENPPPLPARIPRRLPSLPLDDSSYKTTEDDDDDDDIYHKIEDLKNGMAYQNIVLSKKRVGASDKNNKSIAYNNVNASQEKKTEGQVQEDRSEVISFEETYDDIAVLSRINSTGGVEKKNQKDDCLIITDEKGEVSYDDVKNLIPNERDIKNRGKDQIEISNKFSQKKSFLDRVWSRKESPSKSGEDKKFISKVSSNSSSSATEEIVYDDVSDLTTFQEFLPDEGKELPEYNCPPAPRPICKRLPMNDSNQVEEEFYDDVSVYREQYKNHQETTSLQSTQESSAKSKEIESNKTVLEANDDAREEIEHYQSPRSDLRVHNASEAQQNEELYDDIALWVDFTTRQRDGNGKKDKEDSKSMISSDKKSKNRFVINRKAQPNDTICATLIEANGQNDNEYDMEDGTENNGLAKRNTFQKLISKMENSLAKVSAKNSPALSTSKSNTNNNL